MLKRIAVVLSTFFFAFAILIASFLRCCGLGFDRNLDVFSAVPSPIPAGEVAKAEVTINYVLPYPGRILPDSPLWFAKVVRDRLWLTVTTNTTRKAELSLLFADKRLLASYELFKKDKPALALSTLTKAEKYLEEASVFEAKHRRAGADTKSFLMTLANASLKHWQVIEEIVAIAPEDTKPEVIKIKNYAENVYKICRDALQSQGVPAPKNPFERD